MNKTREITYAAAIHEAIDMAMARDKSVFLIGEGVPDPKGVFGTTLGLQQKYGSNRVLDMPVAENGMTGICIGAALSGMRPILVHARIDFSLLSFDQIANVAAKWYFMFGGKKSVPIVIRMIIGRGWGQGSQHSQSLQALFAHIPGLKVVMPSSSFDAKGLLIASIEDNNPVIFIEHRWLHTTVGDVPKKYYKVPLGKAKIVKKGRDITLVATSYMTVESLKAINILDKEGIEVELIDVRTLKPLDSKTIIDSVKKTGRMIVADTGVRTLGFAAEVIARVSEEGLNFLKAKPARVTLPDIPTPTSWALAENYYPTYMDIVEKILVSLGMRHEKIKQTLQKNKPSKKIPSDVPDTSFSGPF